MEEGSPFKFSKVLTFQYVLWYELWLVSFAKMQMLTEFQFTPFLVENSSGWYDIKYNYIIISANNKYVSNKSLQ